MILGLALRGVHIYQVTEGAPASQSPSSCPHPLLLPRWSLGRVASLQQSWALAGPAWTRPASAVPQEVDRAPQLLYDLPWPHIGKLAFLVGVWRVPVPWKAWADAASSSGHFLDNSAPDKVQVPSCRPLGGIRAVLASRALRLALALQAWGV